MPRHCPDCGDIVEVKRYAVPVTVTLGGDTAVKYADPTGKLEDLAVWECTEACGWAEDVEP